MSELLSKVAEILKAPEELVQRSAEARAEASGKSVDEILQSWAGGESVESSAPAEAPVEEVVEEAPVELKKESSLAFIAGVFGVVIFTYIFAYSLPKQQSENLVSESLNNTITVSDEVLKGAEIYNQMN